jgi:hypothetical protein
MCPGRSLISRLQPQQRAAQSWPLAPPASAPQKAQRPFAVRGFVAVRTNFTRREHNLVAMDADIGLQAVSLLLRAPQIRNCHMLYHLNSIVFVRIVTGPRELPTG